MKIKKNIALSDTGFIFNPTTGDSFSLNPIGHDIFQMLQSNDTDEAIITRITDAYMIDRSSVEKDLYDFKNMLKANKLAE